MLLAVSVVDWGVLALYLLGMLAIGAYFSGEQRTSSDFFLAGRSMKWFPVGLSIMATLLSALSYTGIPGESYFVGLKFLAMPVAIWATLPLVSSVILPLYHRLNLVSVYEYLELRYDARVRNLSSVLFVVWRLLWLGGVIYAPCKVLVVAAGIDAPMWLLLTLVGVCATVYTWQGGMKAVIWTDVVQSIVMALGVVLILGCIWSRLDGGSARVWELAGELGRRNAVDLELRWDSHWSIWGLMPHMILSMASFYIADQITAQRYLTAKSLRDARRSFTLNCLSVSFMGPALMLVGLSLLAFYYDHPQAMSPKWVANVSTDDAPHSLTFGDRANLAETDSPYATQSLTPEEAARPLIPWEGDPINRTSIDAIISEGRLLRPNSKQPMLSADEAIDPATGEVDIERLAMRRPPHSDSRLTRGEMAMLPAAKDELLPRFIARQLPIGAAGLILAALMAASMSSLDSGLNSISTLLVMDFHRRLGWARPWVARRRGRSSPEDLTEEDEVWFGKLLVLAIGVAATATSFFIAQVDDIFQIMIQVVNTFGGPLLAVYLLGLFTRRTNGAGALAALIAGTLFTIWMAGASGGGWLWFLWPGFLPKLDAVWPLTFGVAFSLIVGYAVSLLTGKPRTREELRGLVVGIGELGRNEPEEASIAIPDFDVPRPDPPQPERKRPDRFR